MVVVNIICDEANGGWIYSKFIDEFKRHSKHKILVNETNPSKYQVVHFVPYYNYKKTDIPSTAWMSHREVKKPLSTKFLSAAKAVDVAISHSNKYARWLRDQGLHNVIQVIPGVDLDKFKMRTNFHEKGKFVVGYIGRQYTSSSRKNPTLLKKISELPFVDFRTTGGKLSQDQIPGFYADLDVVVSPATVEGGPMAIQEALAVGVPVICFDGVGVADEFKLGVLKVKSPEEFINKLKELYETKSYVIHWTNPDTMDRMRKQVERQTWEKFVKEHDSIWNMIVSKPWRKSGEIRCNK